MASLIADPFRAARLILALRQVGVTQSPVLKAMETIDRAAFCDPSLADLAFEDVHLPIACGQTILPPVLTGQMLQLLDFSARPERVLLVGAGSGYLAALLAGISNHVVAVDRYRRLADGARSRLADLSVRNVDVLHGDGLTGMAAQGPYDRILLTGAVETVDERLVTALSRGGRLVAPLETTGGQHLVKLTQDARETGPPIAMTLAPLRPGLSRSL